MSAIRLRLPVGDYLVDAPDEVLEFVRLFYPHSLADCCEGRPMRRSLQIERAASGWRLLEGGRLVGEHETALRIALALEYAVENCVIRDCDERVALHAGAVGVGGGALVLAGPPDAGKTSCTFELVEMGHAFLAEEVALVDAESKKVLPYLQTLSLDARLLAVGRGHRRPQVARGEGVELEPGHWRYVPERVARVPLPLRALLLPRFAPGEEARIETLTPEEALIEILGSCFEPPGEPEALFDRVIGLISGLPLARVIYPSRPRVQAMLGEIVTRLASA